MGRKGGTLCARQIWQVVAGLDELPSAPNLRAGQLTETSWGRCAGRSSTGQAQRRRDRRSSLTESQKATAAARKDELDDSLGDLNRSTNRLRRKCDSTDTWIETKVQVEQVMEDARRIIS
jgi:hypothetical protein